MKKYRSRLKGPLPVGLRSGSISVASKGYFTVEGDDESSPDLLTKVRHGTVELIEESVTVLVPSEPPPPPEPEVEPEPIPVIEPLPEDQQDVIQDEKDDDSLTSSSEMVESYDETDSDDAGSADEPVAKKKHKRKSSGYKSGNKNKGISG